MREKIVVTVAKTSFFCGGFKERQQVALADNLDFILHLYWFCLSEKLCCAHSSHTALSAPAGLREPRAFSHSQCEQHGMSLQAWDVCVYTPQSYAASVIWSHKWSSRVNHSLNYHCVIHWVSKSAICRGRKSFEIQKSTLFKGKTAWQR